MKNFKNYKPEKYQLPEYKEAGEGIYLAKDPYGYKDEVYVTSLSFEHEPGQYGEENGCPQNITQIPFECILDKFSVWVTDFYYDLNKKSEYIAECTEDDDYDIEDEDVNGGEIYLCLKIE